MNLPDLQAPAMPEDFQVDVTINPLDDDGGPAELDQAPTWAGDANCDVTPSADGKTGTVVPKAAAKAGDVLTVNVSVKSEGTTISQNILFPLGPGGAASLGAAFGTPKKIGS